MSLAEQIRAQYARRGPHVKGGAVAKLVSRERWEATTALLSCLAPLGARTLLEVGASNGSNVWRFLQLGFHLDRITLNDLRPDVLDVARGTGATCVLGDVAEVTLPPADVVYAGTVFSSILRDEDRQRVAAACWRLARRGVLVYDFTWNNPWNPDVRKVTVSDICRLFPEATPAVRRVTLAPPISRHVPAKLYPWVNVPWLRTHVLAWLQRA